MRFSKPLGGFQDVFAWSYEDLHGFDPGLTQQTILIKESMKPVMKKQGLVNSALNAIVQRELGIFLKARIIFPAHSEWVQN